MSRLSPKRRAFISEYLKDFNGTQAAIRAGYSPTRAANTACDLLKNDIIRQEIDAELEALKMDADEALRLLAEKARSAKSESVQVRALETIIKVHGLTERPAEGEFILKVLYGDNDTPAAASPEAGEDHQSSGETEGNLHG